MVSVPRIVPLALRIVQAVFTIIVLGLTGYAVHVFHELDDFNFYDVTPSELSFLLFVSIWSILALLYLFLVPALFAHTALHHKFAILGVEAITMIFWFAGFIALAAWLGDLIRCAGTLCSVMEAATAFGAFTWLLFAISTGLAVLTVVQERGSSGRTKTDAPTVTTHQGV